MKELKPHEWLEWLCSGQDLSALGKNYDLWSATYDQDVREVWAAVPIAAAGMLAKHMPDQMGTVLDVGAGTGLAGVALYSMGFEQIVGIDISKEMLELARTKGVYRSLQCCSIADYLLDNQEAVSAAIATGVFAENHAGPTELSALSRCVRPGGVVVITTRRSFLDKLGGVIKSDDWSQVQSKVLPIYDDPIHILAFRMNEVQEPN